jgi:hypothetical protein
VTDMAKDRMAGAGGAERPAELLPLVKEFRERLGGIERRPGRPLPRRGRSEGVQEGPQGRGGIAAALGKDSHRGRQGPRRLAPRKRRRSRNAELGPHGGGRSLDMALTREILSSATRIV